MSNLDIYKSVFVESLQVPNENFDENLEYNAIPEWDSIGHMTLMSGLEEEFNISLETDDIVDFSSFEKGIEILFKNLICPFLILVNISPIGSTKVIFSPLPARLGHSRNFS